MPPTRKKETPKQESPLASNQIFPPKRLPNKTTFTPETKLGARSKLKITTTPIKARETTTQYHGVYKSGEEYIVRKKIEGKTCTIGPFKDAKEAARCYDNICRKYAKKFDDLCLVLNFPTSQDEDVSNEQKFGGIGITHKEGKWLAYRRDPTTKALVEQGPFSTKEDAIKASDQIWNSFEGSDPRRLNDVFEIMQIEHQKEKLELIQGFEEKIEKDKQWWTVKQKEYNSTIEALEMQIAIDSKPRGKLADMLKTLHAEKQILQRRLDKVRLEADKELKQLEQHWNTKVEALEKKLAARERKDKGWDLLR